MIGEITDQGETIQRLKGQVIHEFTQGNLTGVLIALENGCAIRANKIRNKSDLHLVPTQFACDQMTNKHLAASDASIFFIERSKDSPQEDRTVLLVHISKKHMPLTVTELPDAMANKLWRRKYSS